MVSMVSLSYDLMYSLQEVHVSCTQLQLTQIAPRNWFVNGPKLPAALVGTWYFWQSAHGDEFISLVNDVAHRWRWSYNSSVVVNMQQSKEPRDSPGTDFMKSKLSLIASRHIPALDGASWLARPPFLGQKLYEGSLHVSSLPEDLLMCRDIALELLDKIIVRIVFRSYGPDLVIIPAVDC